MVVAGDMAGEVDILEDFLEDTADFLVDMSEDSLDVHFPVGFPDIAHLPAGSLVAGDFPVDLLAAAED